MPQRVSTKTVSTRAVQGDDSWIILRRFTVEESLALQSQVTEAYKTRRERIVAGETNGRELTEEFLNREAMRLHIVKWNWVDDEGAPLPQPNDDPSVMDRLTDYEVALITQELRGPNSEELKKLSTTSTLLSGSAETKTASPGTT